MSINNTNRDIWKYFKSGDVVKDFEGSIWGNTKFEITGFHGNAYCPMLSTIIVGKVYNNGNPQRCNLGVNGVRLIAASRRPLQKIPKKVLIKLMGKGNVEAKREFMIRLNNKRL